MKPKAIIFGAGYVGGLVYEKAKADYDIIYATDNDANKYGKTLVAGIPIKDKKDIFLGGFDCALVGSYTGIWEIAEQLATEFKLGRGNIITHYVEGPVRAKIQYLESFAKIAHSRRIGGDVCEIGVFRGEFSREINRVFPEKTCYLFDTFEGYDERDLQIDREKDYYDAPEKHLSLTTPELVMKKMPHPEKCIIKKGYFPETFDIGDKRFCFVNLDLDLYAPVRAGLELVYPLLEPGGILVVHDYFFEHTKGVLAAVDEYSGKHNIPIYPIGDGISVALPKLG